MSAFRYFNISHGLRGCYMPDSEPFIVKCETRKKLKNTIESECGYIDSGTTQGFSKKAIASFCAILWSIREPTPVDYVLPYKEPSQNFYSHGVFVSRVSGFDYKESMKDNENSY